MNPRIVLTLLSIVLLFSACQKRPAPNKAPVSHTKATTKKVVKVSPKVEDDVIRSQELFITNGSQDSRLPHNLYFEQTIQLNNTDHTNVDLVLINRGGKPLDLENITLKNSNNFTLRGSDCNQKTLKSHETCTINISFQSEESKIFTTDLEIKSNDRRREIARIKVIGHGKSKYFGSITVTNPEKTLDDSEEIKIKLDAVNNVQLLTITNDGLYPIILEQPKVSGLNKESFSLDSTCNDTLGVAKSCNITIKYDSEKHDSFSIAMLKIPSNGDITPSNKIRLIGYSKPYLLTISQFIVSQNIRNFMDNYFASQQTYYVRTIYQNDIDDILQETIEKTIDNYVIDNGYKLAKSPDQADKIILLYPRVEQANNIADKKRKDMHFSITLNGFLSTKANTKNLANFNDKNLSVESNTSDISFSAITTSNLYYSKEPFSFSLQVDVDHANDKYDVYESVAKIFVNKTFNLIGFAKRKKN